MKTIRNIKSGLVQRLDDNLAVTKVEQLPNWNFCPKIVWKELDPSSDHYDDYRKAALSY